jgi:tRNA A-37 threonylcarbamoyl transferase component Bud32
MLARSGAIIMTFVLLLVLSEIQDARYKMSEEANGPDPDEKNPRHRLLSPEAQNLYLVARRLQQYDHTCNTAPPGVTVDPATQPACPHKSVTPRTGDLLMADYWVAQLNCPSYACVAGTTWQCITCPADAGSGGSGSVDLGAVMAFVGAAVAVVFVILGIARVCIRRKFTGGSSTSRAKVGSTVSSQSSAVAIPIVHPVLTADEAAALMARSKAAAKMSKAAELLKAWELSPLDLTMYQKVGKGGQATVYRGKWKGIDVAIKQAHMKFKDVGGRKAERELEGITQAIRREVRALARVRHPNVVRMFGACFEPTPMVVMAYASAGTLEDALDSNKFQAAAAYVRLLAGIARGMEAVHVHKIIHLDLKPENVLIGPGNVPWITDFGLSTSANMTSLSQSSAGGRGTLPFKAPELFSYPPVISQAADVYAFAILAWCVVAGEQPYETMESAATTLPIAVDQGVRPTLASGGDWRDLTTSSITKLIEVCWGGSAAERPTFTGGEGIVARLESVEGAMVKASDEEAQVTAVTRLIASEQEAGVAQAYAARIEAVRYAATESEAKELAEEQEGAVASGKLAAQHAENTRTAISRMPGGEALLAEVVAMMAEMKADVLKLSAEVASHDNSLSSLTVGELDCPRLVIVLPVQPPASRLKRLMHRMDAFVKDRYRLFFLDPVSGCATPTGPDGSGYEVELPTKWLVEHAKHISDGLKVAKLVMSAGRLLGLPLVSLAIDAIDNAGLPSEAMSQAERHLVRSFELLKSTDEVATNTGLTDQRSPTKGAKVATGKAYKALRKIINSQCNDAELIHCGMRKVRANDGTIEFVAPESAEKFKIEGRSCLVWNQLEDNTRSLSEDITFGA